MPRDMADAYDDSLLDFAETERVTCCRCGTNCGGHSLYGDDCRQRRTGRRAPLMADTLQAIINHCRGWLDEETDIETDTLVECIHDAAETALSGTDEPKRDRVAEAAPDLLAALEEILVSTNLSGSGSPLEAKARAAIAKATQQ